jgi:hypothetical protein
LFGLAAAWFSAIHFGFDKAISDLYTEHFGDKLERSLRKSAGQDATECKRVHVAKGAPIADECAAPTDAQHHNFYASYEVEVANGLVYRGIARNAAGAYVEFSWNPEGDRNAIFAGPDPTPVACSDPPTLRRTWQGVATCTAER